VHDASKSAGGIAVANTGGRCRAYISSTHIGVLVLDWLLLMAVQGLQHGSLNALDGPKRILLGYWLCVIDEFARALPHSLMLSHLRPMGRHG
jgi:hypothetical protein